MSIDPAGMESGRSPDEAVVLVRTELSRQRDPARAKEMARYLKTEMPFYGVSRPGIRPLVKRLVTEFPVSDAGGYVELIESLWREPEREAKYVAIGVARRWKVYHRPQQLPLFRRLIVEGAWWDFVDEIASHLIGNTLRADPEATWPVIDRWIDDDNMWLRRTAIICQLQSKEETDADRLFDYCVRRAHETEFFIRKAIGWALRQHARTDPAAVTRFVLDHRDALSGLSWREATKHLELA